MSDRHVLLENVSYTYPGTGTGEIKALQDVSLSVRDGERIGIVGQNGAGKSTLLQIVAGVLKPTAGRCEVKGKVHAVLAIGMGLREEATGRENLFLDGLLMGRSRAETQAKLDELIAFADLGDFIDRPVRTYSTGMKARLGFASLITIEPEILIVDEALGVGDAFFVSKTTAAMDRLTAKGAIVLLVSHSLASINQTCDRCIWIEGGKVRQDGPSREVTANYREVVHAKEAADIARKFGASGKAWASSPRLTIASVRLSGAGDGQERQLAECGEPLVLDVTLAGDDAGNAQALRVWAERNDGLIVFDERVTMPALAGAGSSRLIHIDLGPLDWRPFIYQFHVECLTPKQAVAHGAATVKIWTDARVQGGTPMLQNAIQVSARRI